MTHFSLFTDHTKSTDCTFLEVPTEFVSVLMRGLTSDSSRITDDQRTVYLCSKDSTVFIEKLLRTNFHFDVTLDTSKNINEITVLLPFNIYCQQDKP